MKGQRVEIEWDSLTQFGFNRLTGEADSLGIRMLVDLNESAVDILTDYMGGLIPTQSNYNSESVKSCFLPKSQEFIKSLLIFCFFYQDNKIVILDLYPKKGYERDFNPQLMILSYTEFNLFRNDPNVDSWDSIERFKEFYDMRIHMIYNDQPRRGLSNISAASGRSQ